MKRIVYTTLVIAALFMLASCSSSKQETKPIHKDITQMVFASGVLEADDSYNLTAQTEGYLVQLNFKESDIVHTGQVLAVIDNHQNIINAKSAKVLSNIAAENAQPNAPALQQIKANIEAAQQKLKLDQLQADRYKKLYENNSVAKLEYENAQLAAATSQANLTALQQQYNNQLIAAQQQEVAQRSASDVSKVLQQQNIINAVVNGKVYQKLKQLGDYVRKGDVIAVIGSPHLIYAKLSVDETSMAMLQPGQNVIVRLNTNKQKIYNATVHEILPTFDANTQSFIVKAYFTDSLDFRIAGTQLEANIVTGEKKNALVIPRNYLSYDNKVTVKDKGVITVQTGIVSTDWVEVTGGLTENDVIVFDNKK
jgi:multidrug efflux pump subunit AcrA (membrane-fusion protein)